MPPVTLGRLGAGALLAGMTLLCVPTAAYATTPGGGDEQSGQSSGTNNNDAHTIAAKAGAVTCDRTRNGAGKSVGPVTPATNWTPPPCWFAPNYDPKAFKALWTDRLSITADKTWVASMYDHYEKGHPYTDWNLDKAGKGYWWTADFRSDTGKTPMTDADRVQVTACFETKDFWAATREQPKEPNAVNPKILSELAYAELRVPDTEISLNPDAKASQTVNLATWAWLDKTAFHPVSVTASVPILGMTATTTATPVGVTLDPGTPDADVYPASGICPLGKDGSIGTPYTATAQGTPPCGVTYRHASGTNGPYHFKATVTWKISWTGTDHPKPVDLPDGTFGTTTDLTVREIQAVAH